jgi:hypothetical protein
MGPSQSRNKISAGVGIKDNASSEDPTVPQINGLILKMSILLFGCGLQACQILKSHGGGFTKIYQ